MAWDKNAMTGPHVKTGEEKAQSLRDATFNVDLELAHALPQGGNGRSGNLDGEECYKVVLTPADGKPVTSYFQKKSGLVVKRTTVAVQQGSETPGGSQVSDYKDFGGILPTKMIQRRRSGVHHDHP